jgi:GNAT superfamily N-acetyltransferase
VAEEARRRGTGRALLQVAALWAGRQGARWLSVQVAEGNAPARAFHAALGMAEAGRYHYRVKEAP